MLNPANIKKTWYYLQKNGFIGTYYAVLERFYAKKSDLYPDRNYQFQPVSEQELKKQRTVSFTNEYRFSILVPMYETKPEFARAMIDSVLAQSYPKWELILADASVSDGVKETVETYNDERIRYHRLTKNAGISENTNEALALATGDYIGLLDHDDFLTPDALYEMVSCLNSAAEEGKEAAFVYSDEDKCDTNAQNYYEPHIKLEFNTDMLFTNNYICHFMVMKADLMKKLGFRKEYDGAQDFDLVLRAALYKNPGDVILHVEKVLYHWRCHDASTAANPRSKEYAYEAGRRASADAVKVFLQRMHGENAIVENDRIMVKQIPVTVVHTKHNGFYRVVYGQETAEDIFAVRKDVGIVAGSIRNMNKITGGIIDNDGNCPYAGLHVKFSGYVHRNTLQQDCDRVDLDNAAIREEIKNETQGKSGLNLDLMQENGENREKLFEYIKKKNYKILYDPQFESGTKRI